MSFRIGQILICKKEFVLNIHNNTGCFIGKKYEIIDEDVTAILVGEVGNEQNNLWFYKEDGMCCDSQVSANIHFESKYDRARNVILNRKKLQHF